MCVMSYSNMRFTLNDVLNEIGALMRRSLSLIVYMLISIMLVGCGSTTHTIRTKDGREYIAREEPDLTNDKFIKFETKDGRKVLVKQDEISSISED